MLEAQGSKHIFRAGYGYGCPADLEEAYLPPGAPLLGAPNFEDFFSPNFGDETAPPLPGNMSRVTACLLCEIHLIRHLN